VCVGVGEGTWVGVGVAVCAAVEVGIGDGLGEGVGEGVGLGDGVGVGAEPDSENGPLNLGGVAPPTMSVPTRSQSGARLALRIHAWKSSAAVGPGAES
jgi:hypothetical protein